MEVILPGSSIESLIDTQVKTEKERNANITNQRKEAENTANIALIRQFQNELSTFLDSTVISSLPLQFPPPKEVSVYSVCAFFEYMKVGVYLRRSIDNWEISYDGHLIAVEADSLQKQLLIELSKIREKAMAV